ncbi:unannotated protein [freshwater metagenome]|uniref:Unannotated protein n=1 Tax=freshwater metagenome TaxID=449393 RepID=A0A6J6S7U4_9ZZZZ
MPAAAHDGLGVGELPAGELRAQLRGERGVRRVLGEDRVLLVERRDGGCADRGHGGDDGGGSGGRGVGGAHRGRVGRGGTTEELLEGHQVGLGEQGLQRGDLLGRPAAAGVGLERGGERGGVELLDLLVPLLVPGLVGVLVGPLTGGEGGQLEGVGVELGQHVDLLLGGAEHQDPAGHRDDRDRGGLAEGLAVQDLDRGAGPALEPACGDPAEQDQQADDDRQRHDHPDEQLSHGVLPLPRLRPRRSGRGSR